MILDLTKLLSQYSLDIKGVIHIGAHFGEEHNTYQNLNIADIMYIEPVNKTFKVLEQRVPSSNNVILHNFALGDKNHITNINVEKLDQWGCSSILTPSTNYPEGTFDSIEEVKVKTLDSLNLKPKYNLLNIDTQGYELNIFKGASKYLNNIDAIMCEVHKHTPSKPLDYIEAPVIEDIIEFLTPYGFELKEVNWAGTSWGDAFFVKNKK